MYSKIALENVRKSFKDYTIYFITLTFAVCIFYSFNSIESQNVILQMSQSQASYMEVINVVISMISVFVAVILGSLIIYANNFLIKKRKKELGIYMTLGMRKRKISTILVQETFLVGIASLLAGLGLGMIISQGLSVFTAKLFEVGMSDYQFIISMSAIGKTIFFFGIIFILVMLFNTRTIAKYELIDLLTASRKNQEIKVKNRWLAFIIFLISLIVLATAYFIILKIGLDVRSPLVIICIVLGVIGTLLFFYGLGGFLLTIIQSSHNIYLKQLNIFVTRQISSNINTNFVSMSLISLMLFVTIGGLSTGLSLKQSLEEGIVAPFDASAYIYLDDEDSVKSVKEAMKKLNVDFADDQVVYYDYYVLPNFNLYDLIGNYTEGILKENLQKGYWESVGAIKLSEYNEVLMLQGDSPVKLKSNEILVTSNFNEFKEPFTKLLKDKKEIKIGTESYKAANEQLIKGETYNSGFSSNIVTLIVPDEVVANLTPRESYVDINYGENPEQREQFYSQLFEKFFNGEIKYSDHDFFLMGYTKQQIYEGNKGMSSLVIYVGLYLGIVFLISSAAILALQQLSEASDSIDRYKSLRKIGATQKMINRTIFKQTSIYFILPLLLAIVHSVFGIIVVNDFVKVFGQSDIIGSSLMTLLILLIIYGGYFVTTYTGYKTIVKNAK